MTTTEKASYVAVVKVKDILPASAGGEGTDYLLNIEEAIFGDGMSQEYEQLEVDSWGWPREEHMQVDPNWTPNGGWAGATKLNNNKVTKVFTESGGEMGFDPQHQPQWDVFDYDKEVTIIDQMSQQASTKKVYVLVNVQEDEFDKSKTIFQICWLFLKVLKLIRQKAVHSFK